MVETLHDDAINDKKVASDFLSRIDTEIDRLTQMVAELTELSRIETGKVELKLEKISLNELIDEVIAQLSPQAERQKLTIVKEYTDNLPGINADRARIYQVITNLVHNAIKFTPSGGKIRITTKFIDDSLSVEISDSGIGIAQEDLSRIFERFYKADKARSGEGSGMGLAIAKHIIESHGGGINARSEREVGSTFTFSLPINNTFKT
jgi:two-component system phosphate regulon sensor histidine kinase PhoR